MQRVQAFLDEIAQYFVDKNIDGLLDVSEYPYVLFGQTDTLVFATPNDFRSFLEGMFRQMPQLHAYQATFTGVEPYGDDLLFVRFEQTQWFEPTRPTDSQRRFVLLRQTGDDLRLMGAMLPLDQTNQLSEMISAARMSQ